MSLRELSTVQRRKRKRSLRRKALAQRHGSLLARDRKFDHVPEAVITRAARQTSPNASDAELLAGIAENCAQQARQYRKGGRQYRAAALEKLAFKLEHAASKDV